MIRKIDHVSITTQKPEKAIEFYSNFLGFKLISTEEIEAMGMRISMLEAGDDRIEIISPIGKGNSMGEGIKHVAFLSDNVEEDLEKFREKGATLLHKEVQRHESVSFFFAKSPSGEYVEVIQYSD